MLVRVVISLVRTFVFRMLYLLLEQPMSLVLYPLRYAKDLSIIPSMSCISGCTSSLIARARMAALHSKVPNLQQDHNNRLPYRLWLDLW